MYFFSLLPTLARKTLGSSPTRELVLNSYDVFHWLRTTTVVHKAYSWHHFFLKCFKSVLTIGATICEDLSLCRGRLPHRALRCFLQPLQRQS